MKIKKSNIMRMENIINNDRMKSGGDFVELVTGDIDKVLKDYFDYKGYPKLEIAKNGGVFSVKVTVTAERIKAFSVLPQ